MYILRVQNQSRGSTKAKTHLKSRWASLEEVHFIPNKTNTWYQSKNRERMKCQSKDKKYFCFRRKIIFVETQFYFYRFPSFCPPSYLAPRQQQDSHSHSRSQRQSSSFWKLVHAAVFFWAAEPGFKKVSSALLKDTGYCPVATNSTEVFLSEDQYFDWNQNLNPWKSWSSGSVKGVWKCVSDVWGHHLQKIPALKKGWKIKEDLFIYINLIPKVISSYLKNQNIFNPSFITRGVNKDNHFKIHLF